MDWNDLNVLIALSEHRTLKATSEKLGVNTTTVWRRIQSLEKQLDCQIVISSRTGYQLTDNGIQILEHARKMAAHADAIQLEANSANQQIRGLIRITAPGNLAWEVLPVLIKQFREMHPNVEFEIIEGISSLDLGRREADLALRATSTLPDNVIAKQLQPSAWKVYGHPDLIRGRSLNLEHLIQEPIIEFAGVNAPAALWFQQQMKDAYKPVRCNSLQSAQHCAAQGLGFIVLPMSETWQLQEVLEVPERYNSTLWLLAHPEMRNAARIKAFWDFLIQQLEQPLRSSRL